MPQVIVTAAPTSGAEGTVTWRERVTLEDLNSTHFAAHLLQRLRWAVDDADAIEESDHDDAGRREPRAGIQQRPLVAPGHEQQLRGVSDGRLRTMRFAVRCPRCGLVLAPRPPATTPWHCPRCMVKRGLAVEMQPRDPVAGERDRPGGHRRTSPAGEPRRPVLGRTSSGAIPVDVNEVNESLTTTRPESEVI